MSQRATAPERTLGRSGFTFGIRPKRRRSRCASVVTRPLPDDDVWPAEISGRARDVLKFSRGPLARSLAPAAFEALLQRPMWAAENAKPAAGRFPLIAIGQGLYYESPIALAALGEFLAGRGFVVVTTPLVGTNSTVVRNDGQDLETQVRDLEFAIARARQLPFVSGDRLGVLGFDQGGMAGVLLAMRNRAVDAFASLDSGIMYPHPSGLPQASPSYDPAALRVPWLHAISAGHGAAAGSRREISIRHGGAFESLSPRNRRNGSRGLHDLRPDRRSARDAGLLG